MQAPAERADKYDATYLRGWDVLREERFAAHAANWADRRRALETDPALARAGRPRRHRQRLFWPTESRLGFARRSRASRTWLGGWRCSRPWSKRVDQGVGQIVDHLKATGDFDNTLILFLSDNGACYEWGPFGFDGVSRRGTTTLHVGDDLRKIGGPRYASFLRQRLGQSGQHAVSTLQALHA